MFSYVIIRKVCSSYYSWYMLLVDGGSMICNQIYLIPRAATWTLLLFRATQSTDFAPIEETLTSALDGLSEYYTTNQLRANPMKT